MFWTDVHSESSTFHSSNLAFKFLRLYINETFHLSNKTWRDEYIRRRLSLLEKDWKAQSHYLRRHDWRWSRARKFHRGFQGFSVTFDRSSTRNVIMAKCNYLARHDAFAPSLSSRSLRKYVYWRRGPIYRGWNTTALTEAKSEESLWWSSDSLATYALFFLTTDSWLLFPIKWRMRGSIYLSRSLSEDNKKRRGRVEAHDGPVIP